MIQHRQLFKRIFIDDNGRSSKVWRQLFSKGDIKFIMKHQYIVKLILNEFDDPKEFLYQLKHDLKDKPVCSCCDNKVQWDPIHQKGIYKKYCSKECACRGRSENKKNTENKKKENYVEQNLTWDSKIDIKRYDNIFYNACIDDNGRKGYSQAYWTYVNTKNYDRNKINIDSYIKNRFNDITFGITEVLYRIKNHIEECPTCKMCDNKVKYDNGRYKYFTYCSRSCELSDPEVQNRIHEASVKRTGSINNSKKISEARKQYFENRTEERRKIDNENISKGILKHRLEIGEEAYKYEYDKRNETKRINGTFNKSKPEDRLAEYIWKYFPDMIRQYKSPQYPTSCDFYIPCIDTYIEYQGNWTHGEHPYGENTDDDNILKKWIEKGTEFYNNAIYVWTVSDVKKRKIAKENNLKFYELWNEKDAIKFINKLYEEYGNNCK